MKNQPTSWRLARIRIVSCEKKHTVQINTNVKFVLVFRGYFPIWNTVELRL
jgi:hypothetical protein